MKKWAVLLITMVIVLCLNACGCKHEWQDATCTSPQRCKLCNKTEGEMLPHTWSDATCTAAKTCKNCKTTEGEPNGHSWLDATCQAPKTCAVCNTTEGDVTAHVPGEWEEREPDYVYAEQMKVQKCTVCDNVVKQERIVLNKLHDGMCVIPSAEEVSTRLANYVNSLVGNLEARIMPLNGSYAVGTGLGSQYTGCFMFTDVEGNTIKEADATKRRSVGKMFGLIADPEAAAGLTIAMIETMSPTLNFDQAKENGIKLSNAGELTIDGIKYIFAKSGSEYMIGFTVV